MATAAKLEEVEKIAPRDPNNETAPGAKVSKKVLSIALAALGVLGALGYWMSARHFESTDDAQVDGHFAQLSHAHHRNRDFCQRMPERGSKTPTRR
jgi:membrane fusion protein, multidrug efflux system